MKAHISVTPMVIALVVAASVAAAAEATSCLHLERDVSAESYVSGQPLEVTLTVYKTCFEGVTSLGVREILPLDWDFVALEAPLPAFHNVSGRDAEGRVILECGWITVQEFPCRIRYAVSPGSVAAGTAVFDAYAIYSLGDSGIQYSPVVVTTLSMALVEGEGEKEGEEPEGETPEPTEGEEEGETSVPTEGEQEGETYVPAEGEQEGEMPEPEEGEASFEGEVTSGNAGCCRRRTSVAGAVMSEGLALSASSVGVLVALFLRRTRGV